MANIIMEQVSRFLNEESARDTNLSPPSDVNNIYDDKRNDRLVFTLEPWDLDLGDLDDEEDLITDLEKDPFISTALSSCLCEVYHKYGKLLAPVTAGLISAKHFKILPR